MQTLGQLRKIDVRTIWPNEARDFTPWLADHLETLGGVLGLDLELQQEEATVGGFSLDLLAKALGTNQAVVIENQFGQTDHDHLGKLLTYAAGQDAGVVVWVGENIREEHRQALDWLNQRSDTETHFFGVVIELLQIDNGRPAPSFRLVVEPNEWRKLQKERARHPASSRAEAYRQYFQRLIDELRETHRFCRARVGQPQGWYSFPSGHSGITYSASFGHRSRVRAELYIGTADAEANTRLFNLLLQEKVAIEAEFGTSLEWEPLEEKIACRVAVYRNGSISDDTETLVEIRDWHIASLLKLRGVLGPRLARLVGHEG